MAFSMFGPKKKSLNLFDDFLESTIIKPAAKPKPRPRPVVKPASKPFPMFKPKTNVLNNDILDFKNMLKSTIIKPAVKPDMYKQMINKTLPLIKQDIKKPQPKPVKADVNYYIKSFDSLFKGQKMSAENLAKEAKLKAEDLEMAGVSKDTLAKFLGHYKIKPSAYQDWSRKKDIADQQKWKEAQRKDLLKEKINYFKRGKATDKELGIKPTDLVNPNIRGGADANSGIRKYKLNEILKPLLAEQKQDRILEKQAENQKYTDEINAGKYVKVTLDKAELGQANKRLDELRANFADADKAGKDTKAIEAEIKELEYKINPKETVRVGNQYKGENSTQLKLRKEQTDKWVTQANSKLLKGLDDRDMGKDVDILKLEKDLRDAKRDRVRIDVALNQAKMAEYEADDLDLKDTPRSVWRGLTKAVRDTGIGVTSFFNDMSDEEAQAAGYDREAELFSNMVPLSQRKWQADSDVTDGGIVKLTNQVANAFGGAVPTIAVSALTSPAAYAAISFAQAKGDAYENAKIEGRSEREAHTYSNLVGASEVVLQYATKGISALGGKAGASKIITKVPIIQTAIKNLDSKPITKTFVNTFLKVAPDGIEDYTKEVLNPVFKNIAFDENNKFRLSTPQAWESALLGMMTAGIKNSKKYMGDYKKNKSQLPHNTFKAAGKKPAATTLGKYGKAFEKMNKNRLGNGIGNKATAYYDFSKGKWERW